MDDLKRMKLKGLGERGLSSLAENAGMDLPQLSKILSGKAPCSLKRAVVLCYVTNQMSEDANQQPDFTLQDFRLDAIGEPLRPTHQFWITEILFRGASAFTARELLSRPEFKYNQELIFALYKTLNTHKAGYTWGSWLISTTCSHKPWLSEDSLDV